jgi:hypothetical protein
MHSTNRKRWAGPRLGVIVTLWVVVLLAPRPARADCAHYAVSRDDPHQLLAGLENRVFVDANGPSGQDPFDHAKGPSPCPGGICSQGPTLPLAPAPDPVHVENWGLLAAQHLFNGPGDAACGIDHSGVPPLPCHLGIFHPPRPLLSSLAS